MRTHTLDLGGTVYLVGTSAVAAHLDVSVNQACVWRERRSRNGFPE